jgi:hypothetical protein
MKRRDFILGLGGAALFANSARGQQNSPIARHSATKLRIADLPFTLAKIRSRKSQTPMPRAGGHDLAGGEP